MAEIKSLLINNKTYKVQKLEVMETIYLHSEFLHLMGDLVGSLLEIYVKVLKKESVDMKEFGTTLSKCDPAAIKELAPKIFAQVITPENKFLADTPAIEEWFGKEENKADVWEVLTKAGHILLGEYLPEFLKGIFVPAKEKTENPA